MVFKLEQKIFIILSLVAIISSFSGFMLIFQSQAICPGMLHFLENNVPTTKPPEYCKTLKAVWQTLLLPIMLPVLATAAIIPLITPIYLGSIYVQPQWIWIPLAIILTTLQLLIITKISAKFLQKQIKS